MIWGADNGSGADWDSPEQAQHVFNLLAKHWSAIAARRLASGERCPMIDNFGIAMRGEEWADGFVAGIEMRKDAWGPIFDDRRADQIVMPILALCSHTPKEVQGQLTAEMREGILEQLPATVQMIAAYWRAPNLGFPRREPLRSTKVGRNEPCPCGSGKKFKKCCGSGAYRWCMIGSRPRLKGAIDGEEEVTCANPFAALDRRTTEVQAFACARKWPANWA